ncbi:MULTISPECIES: YtxH domain-containing protein [Bacillaceae]|uniref:YtxH domain-containing protein n=1 Tax=Bacillaceae TaxID=186817 RepID=UPI001E5329B5|nr:YtxH domain-containing protein [Bacillus sp. Au-Bac7]MCE4051306.1 YtxH domain-containing protein [Bacillus sp. Au-Bac7]
MMTREYETTVVENESSNGKDFLLGAIVGGIVGAATALFLAPKPGKELIQDLNQQAGLLKEKGIELSGTVKDKGTEYISIAKDKTGSLGNTVTKHSNGLMEKVKNRGKDEQQTDNVEAAAGTETDDPFKGEYDEIQKKLEETKKAFDETESRYNQ